MEFKITKCLNSIRGSNVLYIWYITKFNFTPKFEERGIMWEKL